MKIRTLVMALAAFSFMLTACGNEQAKQEQNKENDKQEVVEDQSQSQEEQSQSQKESTQPTILDDIRGVWEKNTLSGVAVDGKTDIERFAYAFCNEYAEYEANQAILDYLKDPNREAPEGFAIDNQKNNGYINCYSLFVLNNRNVTTCYWNRDNGHKLVAFWLDMDFEDYTQAKNCQLLAFYDYDPATDKMTPEPALAKAIDVAMAQYEDYNVGLPDEGKDIRIEALVDLGLLEYTNYIYRWNGNDFSLEKAQ